MKNIYFKSFAKVIIAFLLGATIAISCNAQIDTTIVRGGYKIQPIKVSAFSNDTATQFTFRVFDLNSDTSLPANSYIQFFDRKKKRVLEKNLTIPTSILRDWLDDIIIVNWICTSFGLTKIE